MPISPPWISSLPYLLCVLLPLLPAQAAEPPSIDVVLKRLGFTADDRAALRTGETVTVDLDSAREDQLIAAVAARLDVPTETLAANIRRGLNIERDPGTHAYGALTETDHAEQFRAARCEDASEAELRRLLRVRPDGTFNLSSKEIEQLVQASREGEAKSGGSAALVSQVYRSILANRYRSYLAGGLEGIADYDHGGARLEPRRQLQAVHAQVESFLTRYFPAFNDAMASFPHDQPAEIDHRIYWICREVEGRYAFILAHQAVLSGEDFVLASLRHFFVGHTYESLQAYALALPLETGSAVFYLNSAFTDQITGFFNSVAQSVGRTRMRSDLTVLFQNLRRRDERGR